MSWFDVDGARTDPTEDGGTPPSRKVLYGMVDDRLRVAHWPPSLVLPGVDRRYMRSKVSSGGRRVSRRAADDHNVVNTISRPGRIVCMSRGKD